MKTASIKALYVFILLLSFSRCADEQFLNDSTFNSSVPATGITDVPTAADECLSCDYVVPAGIRVVDGAALGLLPGSVIGLDARIPYGSLLFVNLLGTLEKPIIIRNCGGVAKVDGTGKPDAIKTEKSAHFRITGGNVKNQYGIVITGGTMGVNLGNLSTHFEVDHLDIGNSGFAGLMAKTDPGCNDATLRGNFLMKGIAIHNNYIHDTGGEGIYAGNSFFMGMKTNCGEKLPHEIHYIRIFGNIIKNTGWEGIQLGCATKGASIHANVVENYGLANVKAQNNGIQIGAGTGGVCYNNLIRKGTGNGLIVMGLGDNIIYNNIIDQAGNFGIFCDERYSPGPGFKFINNTILDPASDGIRLYSELVPTNVVINNVIMNPGSYTKYVYPRTPDDAFIYTLNSKVKVEASNNYFSVEPSVLQLAIPGDPGYFVSSSSPLIDRGADISAYNIKTDFHYKSRMKGLGYDIGAVEHF